MKNIVLIFMCMVTSRLLLDVQAVGECYAGLAEDGQSCSAEGKFRSESIHECCRHANATGFSDISNSVVFPDILTWKRRISCRTCAETFNETTKWCFTFRNRADATCIHSPKESGTIGAVDEKDCCLWYNASGYTEEPMWQWSSGYGRWYTSCSSCYKDRFVACYEKFGANNEGDTYCDAPQPRLALHPNECCRRPNATGFAWMDMSHRHKCRPCPVEGGWSSWTPWSPCSATCGDSTRRRVRSCNNPHPKYGGSSCLGKSEEVEVCLIDPNCPGSDTGASHRGIYHEPRGFWSQWSATTPCSATCGQGVYERRRTCLTERNPRLQCEGPDREMHPCQIRECSTMAPPTTTAIFNPESPEAAFNWTWSEWSPCHATCGIGIRSRSQKCIWSTPDPDSEPTNQTAGCPVDSTEVAVCERSPCLSSYSEKYSIGVTIAWSIAGAAIAVLVVGFAFVVCRKQRWYERYVPSFPRKSHKGRHERGDLPPIPPCDPRLYCSVPDLTARYVTKPSAPNDPGQRSLDDDGYEVPRQFEDPEPSAHGPPWRSSTSVGHVYEQLDFDIDHVTQTDKMTIGNGQIAAATKKGLSQP